MIITKAEDAIEACNEIGGKKWVIKTQVHAEEGVKLVALSGKFSSTSSRFSKKWLGKRLVTYQTNELGQPVNSILIEECTDIDKELYLGAIIDRETQKIVFIGSSEGGVNIKMLQKIHRKNNISRFWFKGLVSEEDTKNIAKVLKLNQEQSKQFHPIIENLLILFKEKDLSIRNKPL